MVDWIKVLIIVAVIYLAFLMFTRVTRFILKIGIIALVIGVLVFGIVDIGGFFDKIKEDSVNKISDLKDNVGVQELFDKEAETEMNFTETTGIEPELNFSEVPDNTTNSTA